MTIDQRESFLNRISSRLGRPRPQQVQRPVFSHTPWQQVYADYTPAQLADVFCAQCIRIHTPCLRATRQSLPQVLDSAIADLGGSSLLIGQDERFTRYGLEEVFAQGKREKGWTVHVWDEKKGRENITQAEQADIGITFSDMALAESGTVILFPSAERGRSISLLPRAHIAIVPQSTLVPRFTQAAQVIHQRVERGEKLPPCIQFISGPSNSADIEMNLIVGVHGPVKVTYILVKDL